VIALRLEDRAIFLLGFAKSERENIDDGELRSFRFIAADWLALSEAGIEQAISEGRLQEI